MGKSHYNTGNIGNPCPNCTDGCDARRFCEGCDTILCVRCWEEHNEDAACHVDDDERHDAESCTKINVHPTIAAMDAEIMEKADSRWCQNRPQYAQIEWGEMGVDYPEADAIAGNYEVICPDGACEELMHISAIPSVGSEPPRIIRCTQCNQPFVVSNWEHCYG